MGKDHHSVILGAGPMGRSIAAILAAKGERVTVVTRDGRHLGSGITSRAADLSNPHQTVAACQGAQVIYQCAAPPYHRWDAAFPALQQAAITAAEAMGAVLVAVENLYGYGVAGTLREDLPLAARTRKGALRARLTQELLSAHASGRIRAVAGRATDFFGPEVTTSALGERFWPALLSGKTIDWVGDPDVPHSYAYLPDLAADYVALANTPSALGQGWHMPALPPVTLRAICDMATAAGAPSARIRRVPNWLLKAVGLAQPAAGELVEMRYMFDSPFVIDHSAFDRRIGAGRQGWDKALTTTVAWWQKRMQTAA